MIRKINVTVLYRREKKLKGQEAGMADYMRSQGLNKGNGFGNGEGNEYGRGGKIRVSRIQQDLCMKSKNESIF